MISPSLKRAPQRTCVACHQTRDKKELIRIVRIADKSFEVDLKGKKPGRGAYLCRNQECWQAGCEKGRLEHVLKTTLSKENREQLLKFGMELTTEGN